MDISETSETLVQNVRNAMKVAGVPENGYPSPITQQELVKASGIGRTTLTGQLLGGDDDVNPKLEQITRAAEALGVPPAFLLMRPEDWTRMAQVVIYYGQLVRMSGSKVDALMAKFSDTAPDESADQAKLAAQLARALEVDNQVEKEIIQASEPRLQEEMRAANAEAMRRIFTSAVLPPLQEMNQGERFAALLLSTVFAAHYRAERSRTPTA